MSKVRFLKPWRAYAEGSEAELIRGVAILLEARGIAEEVKSGRKLQRKKNKRSSGRAGDSGTIEGSPEGSD